MSILRTCLLVISLVLTGLIQTAYAVTETDTLNAVLASRSDEDKVRDDARQPLETLTFFQIKPGMTIAEALPGGGWYTRILANYLGQDGTLYGVNYPDSLWPMLSYASPEWIAERIAATQNFTAKVATFTDNGITAQGFTFDTVPPEVEGTVDRVLLIRALHNLNRFQQKAGTRSQALAATHAMLKQDGLVGVVQHRAPATASKEWADGNKATSMRWQSSPCLQKRALRWSRRARSMPTQWINLLARIASGDCPPRCAAVMTTSSAKQWLPSASLIA